MTSSINWSAISKTPPITPDVRAHLTNVYTILTAGILVAAVGSIISVYTNIGGALSLLAGCGLMIWLVMTPQEKFVKRLSLLLGFCFFEGLSIGPLLLATLEIDPSIISTAFFGTVCVFVCFSASALFAERRSYLFLGGFLGSMLMNLFVLGLLNIFFRSPLIFNIILYGGLLVFCGFVCFDTQLIIEKASQGHKDVIWDSLELFIDFARIFVRLLIILSRDKDSKKNRR